MKVKSFYFSPWWMIAFIVAFIILILIVLALVVLFWGAIGFGFYKLFCWLTGLC